MTPLRQINYRGYIISIYPEEDPINPRTECDNFGHMACWHDRYSLGDKHDFKYPSNFHEFETAEHIPLVLPLYLYDHSGITISTGPFSCPWDSGQVGYIYAAKEDIKKEYGCLRITKKVLARAAKALECEVADYDRYLRGDHVRTDIEDSEGESVGGCGNWDDEDYAIAAAKDEVNDIIEHKKAQDLEAELSIQAS